MDSTSSRNSSSWDRNSWAQCKRLSITDMVISSSIGGEDFQSRLILRSIKLHYADTLSSMEIVLWVKSARLRMDLKNYAISMM